MQSRLTAALACAALTLCAPMSVAQADSVEESERSQWSAQVDDVLDRTSYPMPVECISSFCSAEMATVSFDIMPDGTVLDVEISKSSRDEVVDRHAVAFVRKLSPLPASPSYTDPEPLHYTFQYGFGNPQWRVSGDRRSPSGGDLRNRRSYDQPARQALPPPEQRRTIYVPNSGDCMLLGIGARRCH